MFYWKEFSLLTCNRINRWYKNKKWDTKLGISFYGADKRTWTSTSLRRLAPEASASANSAISATDFYQNNCFATTVPIIAQSIWLVNAFLKKSRCLSKLHKTVYDLCDFLYTPFLLLAIKNPALMAEYALTQDKNIFIGYSRSKKIASLSTENLDKHNLHQHFRQCREPGMYSNTATFHSRNE